MSLRTQEEIKEWVNDKLSECTPDNEVKSVVVTDDGKVYMIHFFWDPAGVPNPREDDISLWSTLALEKEHSLRHYAVGDKPLIHEEVELLYEHKDDPDWVILPLEVIFGYHDFIEFHSLGVDYKWWDEEEDGWIDCSKEVIGFLYANKRDWALTTGHSQSDWDQETILRWLHIELHEYNNYLHGEAYGYRIGKWEPTHYPPILKDVFDEAQYRDKTYTTGGYPPDAQEDMYGDICDSLGTEAWHTWDINKDDVAKYAKAFKVDSIPCPVCKEGTIRGFRHRTFVGTCDKCDTILTTRQEFTIN